MNLNKEQYRAAVHVNGPMLVLAGPGSGKTHLLVERIRMMIEDAHIRPESILVITFSRKAARQMQARFCKRVEEKVYPVTFGTFHAVFYHILQEYDPNTNRLINEEEQKACLVRAIESCAPLSDIFYSEDCYDMILGLISSYKNLGYEEFIRSPRAGSLTIRETEEFMKIYETYDSIVRKEDLIDFDDMIIRCRDILYRHEGFLQKWRARFRYFLVDEFQDINRPQYDVLRLLAGDEMNVFAVGDDDQSIYAFRGSRPELMELFLKQYRGCRKTVLSMNYRCSGNIIGAADTLIRHNRSRMDRPMQHPAASDNRGIVEIINTESTDVQAAFVCDMIERLRTEDGYRLKDIAVLYRSDHCAKLFVKMAKSRGIAIGRNKENTEKKAPDMLNVMTAHASKGLEFACVFIIGLQEGLFPHHKNLSGIGAEEERRLMYVAMTRARQRLYMITVSTGHGKRPSRFAADASEDLRYISDRLWVRRV